MSIPKYKKIYDKIVQLILTNQWAVGSNMKSENELIKLFDVSRLTIRNVLSILENEGRISRSRGKATLILDRLLQNSKKSEIKDFSVTLNADYKLIEMQVVKNNFSKKFINSSSLYYIKRIRRLKNNEIYLISRAYIPIDIIGKISDSGNCFNINSIVTLNDGKYVENKKTSAAFRKILSLKEIENNVIEEVIDQTIDWIDKDSNPRAYGLEDYYYSGPLHNPREYTGMRLMVSIEELKSIPSVKQIDLSLIHI